jgi:hypothetical protein
MALYIKRQELSRLLIHYELFKKILEVKGSVIECGVAYGDGLMAWAECSNLLEPYAVHRKIIGFDTFTGFQLPCDKDRSTTLNPNLRPGALSVGSHGVPELNKAILEFDNNRYLNKDTKIELVIGDALDTIPEYINKNQHLIVSLLYLDFDLYEPTKVALEYFLPRIPKGGIIAFDEINNRFWPGETIALLEQFKSLNTLQIQKFSFDHNISYVTI